MRIPLFRHAIYGMLSIFALSVTTCDGSLTESSTNSDALLTLMGGTGSSQEFQEQLEVSQQNVGAALRIPGTNTQDPFPYNIQLADIDGDGKTDLVQHSNNKIFVSSTDYKTKGKLHAYLERNISKLFVGRFSGSASKDTICVVLDNNVFKCYGASTDNTKLWWGVTQGNFISSSEDVIVADYDGDGRDDMMLYNRYTGAIRFYSRTGSFFAPMSNVSLGNLSSVDITGMQFRAGDFNGDGRYDLIAVKSNGQLLKYSSVFSGGVNTFWWAFTTGGGFIGANDQVSAARISLDGKDDVAIHNTSTGQNRFYFASYNSSTGLVPITYVLHGQLPVRTNSKIFWGNFYGDNSEPGGSTRNDALTVWLTYKFFYRTDGRYDSANSKYTYWSAFSQYAPKNNTGWTSIQDKRWLVLKCKFKNSWEVPKPNSFFQSMFVNNGQQHFGPEGIPDYFNDVTYGTYNVRQNVLSNTWYEMDITYADAQALYAAQGPYARDDIGNECLDAAGKSRSGYPGVVTLLNKPIDTGAYGWSIVVDENCWSQHCIAHEMGHGFGWSHSWDDGPGGVYYDTWDVMGGLGNSGSFRYTTAMGVEGGPGLNAPNRMSKSFIPSHRQWTTTNNSYSSTTLDLAALNRPESFGYLVLRIGTNNNDYYTVEFRQKRDQDRGIPGDGVLIHRVQNGKVILITDNNTGNNADLQTGESRTLPSADEVQVLSIDSGAGTARVRVITH